VPRPGGPGLRGSEQAKRGRSWPGTQGS
jgi:hypothetical protein